jgi:hypothetical protein
MLTTEGRQPACASRPLPFIWWEYYSGREVVEGWPHLDGYLGGWTKDIRITPADLRSALVQCGYHAEAGQGTGAGQPQLD